MSKEELNQIRSKNYLEGISSKYIFELIIKNISKLKLMEIIKYNKKEQKKINLSFQDYKNYSQKYSTIEIELIPLKNTYDNFIQIINENDKNYFHIYFNDNIIQEIKRTYLTKNDNKVEKILIKIDYQVIRLNELFNNCHCIESIIFKKFSRNNIINISNMFKGCKSLKKIIFSKFNTDNVLYMNYMFFECTSLKELNLSNFNTEKVKNMRAMFYWCQSLEKIIFPNNECCGVNDMSYMFCGCSSLKELDMSNFYTDDVIDMKAMFSDCVKLSEIDISHFNTKKVIDMNSMFHKCSNELKNKIKEQNKYITFEAFY